MSTEPGAMATAERRPLLLPGDVEEAGVRASPPPVRPLLSRLTATLLGEEEEDGGAAADGVELPPTAPSWGVVETEPAAEPVPEPASASAPLADSSDDVTSSVSEDPPEDPVSAPKSAPIPIPSSHRRTISVSPPQSFEEEPADDGDMSLAELAGELRMLDGDDRVETSDATPPAGSDAESTVSSGSVSVLVAKEPKAAVKDDVAVASNGGVSDAAWFGRSTTHPVLVDKEEAWFKSPSSAAAAAADSDDDTGLGLDDDDTHYDVFTGALKPVYQLQRRVKNIEDRVQHLESAGSPPAAAADSETELTSDSSDDDDGDAWTKVRRRRRRDTTTTEPEEGSSLVSLM